MHDYRNHIIQTALLALVKGEVPQETIDMLRNVLTAELDKVEVQERVTDLTLVDDSAQKILQDFLKTKLIEGKSKSTIKRYGYEVGRLLDFYNKPLEEYTTADIRQYLAWRETHAKRKQYLSKRTLDGMRKCYSSFFKWCTAERIIPWNPCASVNKIKYQKNVVKPFTTVELQKLREACQSKRDIAMVDWFYATGCRVGEVATTKLSDINFRCKTAVVTGKGNKQRTVYINDVCTMHLSEYLAERLDNCDALFVSSTGKPLTIGGIQNAVKRIGERAGVDKVHCHRFRHSLATYLATRMPITEVAAILGHEGLETISTYVQNDRESIQNHYTALMCA